jgi:hypothetical protein
MAGRSGIVEQERSTGAILRDIIHDIETIIRAEVKLAKTELREKARTASGAAGWLAAAGGCGAFRRRLLCGDHNRGVDDGTAALAGGLDHDSSARRGRGGVIPHRARAAQARSAGSTENRRNH